MEMGRRGGKVLLWFFNHEPKRGPRDSSLWDTQKCYPRSQPSSCGYDFSRIFLRITWVRDATLYFFCSGESLGYMAICCTVTRYLALWLCTSPLAHCSGIADWPVLCMQGVLLASWDHCFRNNTEGWTQALTSGEQVGMCQVLYFKQMQINIHFSFKWTHCKFWTCEVQMNEACYAQRSNLIIGLR